MKYSYWWLLLLHLGFSLFVNPFCGDLPKDGVVYQKLTVFAHLRLYWRELFRPCSCTIRHTVLQGDLTAKASAYPDELCKRIADIALREFPGGNGPWGVAAEGIDSAGRGTSVVVAAAAAAVVEPLVVMSLMPHHGPS